MTRTLAWLSSAFSFALFITLASGCDCGGTPPGGRACTTARDCRTGEVCIDRQCVSSVDGGDVGDGSTLRVDAGPRRAPMGLRLDPATADLVAVDGAMPTQAFRAVVLYDDGTEGPAIGPIFSIDALTIGTMDTAGGTFTANGVIGGSAMVHVEATIEGVALMADGSVSVRLERTVLGEGAPADSAAMFDGAPVVDEPSASAGIVYPLDQAVMPQNVYPADVQWTRGAAGDLFRVRMTKPHVTVTAYVAYDGMNHWLSDAAGWRSLTQTDADDAASIQVDRLEAAGARVITGAPRSVTFARAALTGSVYYWDIARGRIVRIDDGTATPVEFMPNPPVDATGGSRCVGCHSVSPSGRYMAGRLGGGDNIGGIFDLTTDLTPDPAPTVWPTNPSSIRWWFSSWSPDETRMIVSFSDPAELRLYDPFTGARVTATGALPTTATHPAWSPDGTRIAYAANVNAWGGAFTAGDIGVLPVVGPDSFGAPTIVHRGNTLPGGSSDSYPTWSPDSMWIAFGHGTGCRSESHQGSLWIMQPDGSAPTRLDRASGSAEVDFQPRFSPFQSGGYYWLSFLSRREYGNAAVGTAGSTRQQIWVTAIRVGAAPGEDSSAVPYWVPGQRTTSMNISAYWAPRPCRPDGESCSVGSECCGGDCRPGAGGELVCSPPPPERCRVELETCGSDADCCEGMGLSCLGNVCVRAPE